MDPASLLSMCTYIFSKLYLFLIEGKLLHNIVLAPAIHEHESAIGTPVSPPLFNLFPTSHPSRLLQSAGLSPLSHTANSHWLSVLHMVVYLLPCYSLCSPHPLLSPTLVYRSVLYVCISTVALKIGSSVPSF